MCKLIVDGIRADAEISEFDGDFIELFYKSGQSLNIGKEYRLRLDFGKSYAVIFAEIAWDTDTSDGRRYLGAKVR